MVVQMLSILHNSKYPLIFLLVVFTTPVIAAIGTVQDQQGPDATLYRDKDEITAKKDTPLEMNDAIETKNTKLVLGFNDNTKVAVTEQSQFIIDEFAYNPDAKSGKLSGRVTMGTVRYASGGVAKNNPENVRLRTPTATVSVRGTDFTMVVNEIGQSMITLLPTCPGLPFGLIEPSLSEGELEEKCTSGEIEVSTDAGMVIMNQAYQTTVVSSRFSVPTEPKVLTDRPLINNLLIIVPPKQFPDGFDSENEPSQVSFLDEDFLEFDELMKELLAESAELNTNRLDRDEYGGDFLDNLLDLTAGDLGDAMEEYDGVLPTIHKYPWIKNQSYYNEEEIGIRSERIPHVADVVTERESNTDLTIIQDGVQAEILINGGASVQINITQTQ